MNHSPLHFLRLSVCPKKRHHAITLDNKKDRKLYLMPPVKTLSMGFRTIVGTAQYLDVDKFHSVSHKEILLRCRNKIHPVIYEHNMWNMMRCIGFVNPLHIDVVSKFSFVFNKVLNPVIR